MQFYFPNNPIPNEEYGFLDHHKRNADFLEYLLHKVATSSDKNSMAYRHFERFCNGKCKFGELTLKRCMIQHPLHAWIKAAGIRKHITFHCFRHTFATLQIALGTDIYTVSKMLTHKSVKTTQIYADLVNSKKRESANRISLR